MLTRQEKERIVKELSERTQTAQSVIASEYSGLEVADITVLREQSREVGVHFQVIKNTLAKRVFDGTEFEAINERLSGHLILAFSFDDPAAAARILAEFCKTNDKLVPKAIAMGGKVYEGSELARMAKMPTRDQAIAQLLQLLQAPVTQLVRTLAAPAQQLVMTVAAVKEKKAA